MTKIVDAFGNPINSTTSVTATETVDKEEILFIQTPIFILFAEYLGYVSAFVEHAENWCNPIKPMPKPYIKTLLEREARSIYDQMLKTYSEDEIRNFYMNFYPCGLDELDTDLKEKRKKDGDDLPF